MIFRHLTNRLAALFLIASLWSPAFAQTMDTPARHAILIEAETGEVLYEKEADVLFPPASMSKMMTVYIAFERIREGSLALEDTFTVSNQAWRRWAGSEASLMFVSAREEVTVSDLLHGIIVSSGNDACTVLAEGLAGTEGSFAEWMNEKAGEIGMRDSYFANASGWPDPSQHTTARDLAVLAGRLIEDFPDLYRFFGERSFTYGLSPEGQPITQPNRNPILYTVDGADGLKTGHTRESGYALTGSAQRAGRRIILVVSGLNSNRARARESQRLIEYAFRNFKPYATFGEGEKVADANVWLGEGGTVPLVVSQDVKITMSRAARNRMKVTLAYDEPIPAPIHAGQPIATVTISAPNREDVVIPLVAGEDVAEISGFGRLSAAFQYLLFGSSGE